MEELDRYNVAFSLVVRFPISVCLSVTHAFCYALPNSYFRAFVKVSLFGKLSLEDGQPYHLFVSVLLRIPL